MDSRFEALERLSALHRSGALSDEEFAAQKASLLADESASTDRPNLQAADAAPDGGRRLFSKVISILLRPGQAWAAIVAEAEPPRQTLTYVLILSAVPAIAFLFGVLIVVAEQGAEALKPTLYQAAIIYLLSLLTVGGLSAVVGYASSRFGGVLSYPKGFLVAAYSFTPVWVLGMLLIAFPVQILAISLAGLLYGGYVLYRALPIVMGVPQASAAPLAGISMVAWVVIFMVARTLLATLIGGL